MNEQQINWASLHDWFVRRIGNAVLVRDIWTKDGKVVIDRQLTFDNYKLLRNWAGY